MRRLIILVFLLTLTSISCKKRDPQLQPLDLLSQGLPLKINAPVDVQITATDLGIMKDVTVKNESGYSIQIFESEVTQLNLADILYDLKKEIEESKFFSKIIQEDVNGFIFEKKVDENYINYDFRLAKVRGDKQYLIQAGLSSQYTLDQIEIMYQSVQ